MRKARRKNNSRYIYIMSVYSGIEGGGDGGVGEGGISWLQAAPRRVQAAFLLFLRLLSVRTHCAVSKRLGVLSAM